MKSKSAVLDRTLQAQVAISQQGLRPTPKQTRKPLMRVAGLLAYVAVLASLVSIWLPSSLPPTCDGPSHVYNAFIARATAAGQEPYTSTFVLRQFPRSNFVTDLMLGALGEQFGWVASERIWITVVLLLQFAAFAYMLRPMCTAWRTIFAGYLANNWFLWMGFYDFALSLSVFVGYMAVLLAEPGAVAYLLLLAFSIGLYATHFFTFAVALFAAAWVFAWRLAHRQMSWRPVSVLLIPAMLFVNEMLGPAGNGGIGWWGWKKVIKTVAGVVASEFLVSFNWVGALASVMLTVLIGAALVWYFQNRRLYTEAKYAWAPLLGLVLFAISIVAPPQIGVGTHVAVRLRLLGDIVILTALARYVVRLPYLRVFRIPAWSAVLSVALLIQSGSAIQAGKEVFNRTARLRSALTAAGLSSGEWVASRLEADSPAVCRIIPFRHFADRAYISGGLRSLDNYEATAGSFQVRWRHAPSAFTIKSEAPVWKLEGFPEFAGSLIDRLWLVTDDGEGVALPDTAKGIRVSPARIGYGYSITGIGPGS